MFLKKSIWLNYFVHIINGIVPLIMILIFAKFYDSTFLGKYFYYISFISILTLVIDFGFNLSALRGLTELLSKSNQISDISKFISSIQFAKYLLSVLAIVIYFILFYMNVFLIDNLFQFITLLLLGIFVSISNFAWLFYPFEESQMYSVVLFLLRLISLLFLVVVKISVFNSLLVTYVPLIFSNLILLFYILKKKGINFSLFKVVSFKDILNQYKSGYEFFINSIVVSLGTTVWPIIFGKYVPYSQIAAFGVMDKFTRGIVNFIAPLPNFLLSKSNPLQTLYSFVKRYSFLFSIVVCFLLLIPFVFMLIPDGIFSFLIGKDFLQNRGIMNFYSFHFIIGFINYFSFIIIVHVKKERVYTISFVISYIIWICIGFYSNSFIYLPLLIDLSFISFTLFYLIYYKHVSFNNNSNL